MDEVIAREVPVPFVLARAVGDVRYDRVRSAGMVGLDFDDGRV